MPSPPVRDAQPPSDANLVTHACSFAPHPFPPHACRVAVPVVDTEAIHPVASWPNPDRIQSESWPNPDTTARTMTRPCSYERRLNVLTARTSHLAHVNTIASLLSSWASA
eukprot:364434-Chlamydomonas_euryale.AAC.10